MRQTGTTSQQIMAAPKNAVYVWAHSNTTYPTMLARRLGRTDINFVSPDWLLTDNWRGRRLVVIIDHATELSEQQLEIWVYLNQVMKLKKGE